MQKKRDVASHVGSDGSGGDGVDVDVVSRPLVAECFGELGDGAL